MNELNGKNMKNVLFIVAFAILFYWTLQNLSIVWGVISTIFRVIFPFILGLCMAFILNIPVKIIENFYNNNFTNKNKKTKGKKADCNVEKKSQKVNIVLRIFSIVLSICIIIFILYFVMFLIIPELITTFNIFKLNIPNFIENIKVWLIGLTDNYPDITAKISSITIDWKKAESAFKTMAQGGITALLTSSFNIIKSVVNGIFNFIMALIFALYILFQKEKLLLQTKKVVLACTEKEKAQSLFDFARLTDNTFSRFISGQVLEACILGLLCFVGMTIFGFPYAAAISVLVGVTALIPFLGAFIGVGIGAILIFAINPTQAMWFIIFFLILQQIEGNLIYPKVVGDSVGLPAIWVILAVTVGGSLFGVIGMMVGVPFVSVLYKTFKKKVNKALKNKQIEVKE